MASAGLNQQFVEAGEVAESSCNNIAWVWRTTAKGRGPPVLGRGAGSDSAYESHRDLALIL